MTNGHEDFGMLRQVDEDVPELSGRARATGRARLLRAVEAEESEGGRLPIPRAARPRSQSRRRLLGVAVPTAVAAAMVGTLLVVADDGDGGGGLGTERMSPVSAQKVLNGAATQGRKVEEGAKFRVPRGDQYIYSRQVMKETPVGGGKSRIVHPESWKSVDGKHNSWVNERGDGIKGGWISPPDKPNETSWPPSSFKELMQLPRDPERLLAKVREMEEHPTSPIEQAGKQEQEDAYFSLVALLFHGRVMPPGLRAATFEAIAKVPGVKTQPNAVDMMGRHGIGVSRKDTRGDLILGLMIFDAKTYEYLGTRDELEINGKKVVQFTALQKWGISDKFKERPKG
jgi:hypothetical protein